jgi:glycosyltransferase involved in cell wall biosynthesis
MGVDVIVASSSLGAASFRRLYPECAVPVVAYDGPAERNALVASRDAAVATLFSTVEWMERAPSGRGPIRAYYVQDFEPWFFASGASERAEAMRSYTRFADLVRLTKTPWTRDVIRKDTGADAEVVGPSVDLELFRPRARTRGGARVVVAAMIRPASPYRQPARTLEALDDVWSRRGDRLSVVLFGSSANDPALSSLRPGFPYWHAGELGARQMASLLSEVDVFVDFSAWQAMGLTALEAMASGAAVVVPATGGSGAYAHHEHNALVVDTSSREACAAALGRLVDDPVLRSRLQAAAIEDAGAFPPEVAAFRFLSALWPQTSPSAAPWLREG